MQVVAVSKSVRQSPRKVALVASLVRGRSVEDAITILDHTPKRAALPIKKTILSAQANAQNNHKLDGKSLQITALEIGPAPSMKRFRPVAHGRAQPFVLRSTNIRVVVEGKEVTSKKAQTSKGAKVKDDAKGKDAKKTDEALQENLSGKKRRFRTPSKNANQNAATTKQRTGIRGNK